MSEPVAAEARIALIDALRGFALSGVLIGNVVPWFSGYLLVSRRERAALPTAHADDIVRTLVRYTVDDRFISIFSLLFGVGFALQTVRLEQRGTSPTAVYARRQLVLLAIGLVHLFVFWWGDILTTYALCGLVLLAFRRANTRSLAVLGALFATSWGALVAAWPLLVLRVTGTAPHAAAADFATWTAITASLRNAIAQRDVLGMIRSNARYALAFHHPASFLVLPTIFGRFALGVAIGRLGVLAAVRAYRRAFEIVAVAALVCALVDIGYSLQRPTLAAAGFSGPWWSVAGVLLHDTGALAHGIFYAAVFALLFQTTLGARILGVLAPAGRIALTNYLTQSVIAVAIFSCGGLFGTFGPSQTVPMARNPSADYVQGGVDGRPAV